MRILIVPALLVTSAQCFLAQDADLGNVFDRMTSSNRTISIQARDEIIGRFLPRLIKEDAALLANHVPVLLRQNSSKQDRVRILASSVFVMLADSRQDSATTLSSAFPALMSRVKDPVPEVRAAAVETLSSLNPSIPKAQLLFLIDLVHGADQSLADLAIAGVTRMAESDPDAAGVVEHLFSPGSSKQSKIAAIGAMWKNFISEPKLLRLLGRVLNVHDPALARSALLALSQLGKDAVTLNIKEVQILAKGDDKTLASKAQQLIDMYFVAQ